MRVTKKIEHRSRSRSLKTRKPLFETSGWFQNVPCQNTYQKCRVPMTYDVPFLRHVTSNKIYNCCIFSNFVNSEPIDLKIGTHIDLGGACIGTEGLDIVGTNPEHMDPGTEKEVLVSLENEVR